MAEKAARGYAHTEAVVSLAEALVHAERLPEGKQDRTQLDLLIRQADSLFWAGRHEEIVALLRGQEKRLVQLSHSGQAGQFYFQLGRAYSFLGQRERARHASQSALQHAQQSGDILTMAQAHVWLTMEMNFTGDFGPSIAHGQQAVSLLEETQEYFWLGMALYFLGLTYTFAGDFPRALAVVTRLHALGENAGDRRLQVQGLLVMGWLYTLQGEWEASLEVIQQASVISPDAFETAVVLGRLGYAYLEKGSLADAVSILEHAVEQAHQYRSRQVQSWFKTYLSEAYLLERQIENASSLGQQALTLAEDSQHPWGVGLAQRILGRIAHTIGNLTEAERSPREALATFDALQSRYERARTYLDLAALVHAQGKPDTATEYLSTAYAWFSKLQVPKWVEKTEQLAREYGVTLIDVALEELPEGSS